MKSKTSRGPSKVIVITANRVMARALCNVIDASGDLEMYHCRDPFVAFREAVFTSGSVVILDYHLPSTDGLSILRLLKAKEETRDIPIIVVGDLSESARAGDIFGHGANDLVIGLPDKAELLARLRSQVRTYIAQKERDEAYGALRDLQRMLEESNSQLEESNRELQALTLMDDLTHIPNRRAFDQHLSSAWDAAVRGDNVISVIIADVDYFKQFNDLYGHIEGGRCLRALARTISGIGLPQHSLIARYGGDEFALVLQNALLGDAVNVAEAIQREVENMAYPHAGSKVSGYVTLSIGVAVGDAAQGGSAGLMEAADQALYEAKRTGRNRYCPAT